MNYFKLDLPKNPLHPNFTPITNGNDGWHVYKNISDVLNTQTLECFNKLGLEPDMIVMFGSIETKRTEGHLHTDLGWYDNKWQPVSCAVNWELTQTVSILEWHNADDYKEVWPTVPPTKLSYPDNYLQGIFYIKNLFTKNVVMINKVIASDTLLESVKLEHQTPILFNTSMPHGVTYESCSANRFMMSVRFRFEDIPSWEKAVEIFSTIKI